ncbi:hypothetical protein D3C80_1548320 [compost metagenome]
MIKIAKVALSSNLSLSACFERPENGKGSVSRDTHPLRITDAKVALSCRMTLLCCFAIPVSS